MLDRVRNPYINDVKKIKVSWQQKYVGYTLKFQRNSVTKNTCTNMNQYSK